MPPIPHALRPTLTLALAPGPLAAPAQAEDLAPHGDGTVTGMMDADQAPGAIVALVRGEDTWRRGHRPRRRHPR